MGEFTILCNIKLLKGCTDYSNFLSICNNPALWDSVNYQQLGILNFLTRFYDSCTVYDDRHKINRYKWDDVNCDTCQVFSEQCKQLKLLYITYARMIVQSNTQHYKEFVKKLDGIYDEWFNLSLGDVTVFKFFLFLGRGDYFLRTEIYDESPAFQEHKFYELFWLFIVSEVYGLPRELREKQYLTDKALKREAWNLTHPFHGGSVTPR